MKGGKELLTRMHAVMTNVWEVGEMPKDWEEGIICPTFRMGDILNYDNYIAQHILQFFFFSNFLHGRIKPYAEGITGNYQCGFRTGSSISGQIHALTRILEKENSRV